MHVAFHVLLVLADSSFARSISTALTTQGHSVHTTETVSEAASILRRDTFDAVFVEGSISRADDGLEFARSILLDPRHPQVIVFEPQTQV
jgi:CheY-like chemotaxis protein